MVTRLAPSPQQSPPVLPASRKKTRSRWPWLAGFGLVIVAVLAAGAAAVVKWSGASLAGDPTALARVQVQRFGGTLESARAVGPDGRPLALTVAGGKLTPHEKIAPGRQVTVEVVMRRPGWSAWLIGKTRSERLTVRAPVVHIGARWVSVPSGSPVEVSFGGPVATVAYTGGDASSRRLVNGTRSTVSIPTQAAAGSLKVAVAARAWESLGPPVTVRWFPSAKRPVALVSPEPGGRLSPSDPLRLTFSSTVKAALGSALPRLTPATPGHWRRVNSHTIVFTPSGLGVALGSTVRLSLPHTIAVAGVSGRSPHTTREIDWTVPPPSTLRLQELLADAGYMPVEFKVSGASVPRTPRAQAGAAAVPPKGHFVWRYSRTPRELRTQWTPGTVDTITRGAIMKFEDEHQLAVDGLAGPGLWKVLLADTVAGQRITTGYSYVYVHRNVPQLLTLWHNGHTVITSPGNTGIPAAPTELGTFPVFEHLEVTTMSGTNPDGTTYNDPGIKWVSYFNGGDALHTFNRASFGTPQSLGCVELPEAAAAKIWPYTPIGTLVTIEN